MTRPRPRSVAAAAMAVVTLTGAPLVWAASTAGAVTGPPAAAAVQSGAIDPNGATSAGGGAGAAIPAPDTGRAMVVLPGRVDLVDGRQVVRKVPFPGTAMSLPGLVWLIGDTGWIEAGPGAVFTLHSSLVQAPGTSLVISAPDVSVVRMAGPGLSISGERASVAFKGVTVTSWSGAGPISTTSGGQKRPYVRYTEGSHVDVSGSHFQYLGSGVRATSGFSLEKGASGTISGTTFQGNHYGMLLSGASGVSIMGDTFTGSELTGLAVTTASRSTTIASSVASDNGQEGFLVTGRSSGTTVRAVQAVGNRLSGVVVALGSASSTVTDSRAIENKQDGFEVTGSDGVHLVRNTAVDNRYGIAVRDPSHNAVLDTDHVQGGLEGVVVDQEAIGTAIRGVSVQGATRVGLVLAGKAIQVQGGTIAGSALGAEVYDDSAFTGTSISEVQRGIRVLSGSVRATGLHIQAVEAGITIAPAAHVALRSSEVDAHTAVVGSGLDSVSSREVSAFPWLTAFGLLLVLAAVGFEVIRRQREHGLPRTPAPPAVWNVT